MNANANDSSVASPQTERPRIVLVTGLSGSGKSTAANALEDIGYYCVDNLPLPLLRTFLADPIGQVGGDHRHLAIVTDVRAPGFAEAIPAILEEIDRDAFDFQILFFEASENALLRRFSATRRAHPLGEGDRPVLDGIRRERQLLDPLRAHADRIFDTSDWTVHDVRSEIQRELGSDTGGGELVVSLVSFGFKHGAPSGVDLVFDVRFLPNPFFIPDLKEQTGRDAGVQDYLDRQPDFAELLDRLGDLLAFLLPRYRQEHRRYVSVGIGCTGGRHRSVATVLRLSDHLAKAGWSVRLRHRDIDL